MAERKTIIKESLTVCWIHYNMVLARLRGIALQNSIGVASAHKILTVHMYKWVQHHIKCIWLHGVYIEKEWRFQNRINTIVTCWRNVCDVGVLRIPPGDALIMLSALTGV